MIRVGCDKKVLIQMHEVRARCAQGLLEICTRYIHEVRTRYIQVTHGICTIHARHMHDVRTSDACSTPRAHTECTRYIHEVRTRHTPGTREVRTRYIQKTFTSYARGAYEIYATACTCYIHTCTMSACECTTPTTHNTYTTYTPASRMRRAPLAPYSHVLTSTPYTLIHMYTYERARHRSLSSQPYTSLVVMQRQLTYTTFTACMYTHVSQPRRAHA